MESAKYYFKVLDYLSEEPELQMNANEIKENLIEKVKTIFGKRLQKFKTEILNIADLITVKAKEIKEIKGEMRVIWTMK